LEEGTMDEMAKVDPDSGAAARFGQRVIGVIRR
jgi:hypothetical protein